MYKICFYVPTTHVDSVKQALFDAGAGQIGNYGYCAWQVLGQGQFMPLEGSQSFIGQRNELSFVEEYKVELVCEKESLHAAVSALKAAHPYEEPAYHIIRLETF